MPVDRSGRKAHLLPLERNPHLRRVMLKYQQIVRRAANRPGEPAAGSGQDAVPPAPDPRSPRRTA